VAIIVAALGLVLVAGCAPVEPNELSPSGSPVPAPHASTAPRVPTDSEEMHAQDVLNSLAARVAPAPTVITVAELGIEMPVVPQGLDDSGAMAIPASVFDAGWYQHSAGPGASQGTTVIASHVVTRAEGRGPFARLLDASPGMTIAIVDARGDLYEYRISTVERIAKDDVPLDRVFTTVGEHRLVLVTCGGDYDYGYANGAGRYTDNVIVTAERQL
jgi:sortase (surface protein transpeptidase)